jgi:hypothetical protein
MSYIDDTMVASLKTLAETRILISDINNWCQQEFALDKNGKSASIYGDQGVKWSLMGAFWKSLYDFYYPKNEYLPFRDERRELCVDVEIFAGGMLDSYATQFYKKFCAEELNNELNNEYIGIKAELVNDTHGLISPREATHKRILELLDHCIGKLQEEIRLRDLLKKQLGG